MLLALFIGFAPSRALAQNTAPSSLSAAGELPNMPVAPVDEISNTWEDPNRRYFFVGARYRGTIIPQFLMNLFINDGATIYSNTVGAEIDIRKARQSIIPWIQYTDYNTGNFLALQKGQADTPNNYTVINSSLKAVYLGLDALWSAPIADHLDFEYGFGVGVGYVFGDLQNNWVYQTANGPLVGSSGNHYAECTAATPGIIGCDPRSHTGPNPHKVNGYVEPNWFGGGSVPVVFPHISIPQFSLRYKPIKQLQMRWSLGFSLTGFWVGFGADYGLERSGDGASRSASNY